MATPFQLRMRRILAWVAVILAVATVVWMVVARIHGKDADVVTISETMRDAVKMKQEQSTSAFNVALAVLALLWATLLAKSGEASFDFTDWPPTLLFLLSNAQLIGSMFFHYQYLDLTANELWTNIRQGLTTYPDVVSSYLNNQFFFQRALLLSALVSTVGHLVVVNKLKP